jgi:hypothetical protein
VAPQVERVLDAWNRPATHSPGPEGTGGPVDE